MRLGTTASLVTFVAWMTAAALVSGQAAQDQGSQPADQVFKNILVLKGLSVDQFMGTMGFFSASTGLNCTDCHVEDSGGNWAKYADDNALKRRARGMVVMMNTINQNNFGGRQVVTCFTCHRGHSRPHVMPSLDLLYSSPPPEEPGDPIAQANGQPPADQILDKYLAALGGVQRLNALKSFTGKGNYIGYDDADKSPFEMFAVAPGQSSIVAKTHSGETRWTFDGRAAWIAAPLTDKPIPVLNITGQDLDGVRVEAQLRFPAQIKQALTNWRTGFPSILDDRDINVVQATTPGGGTVTLCFDAETNLLVRLVRFSNSPVGRIVTRVDYSDYRDVAGVKMPFKWTVTWLDGRSTYELASVEPNATVNPAQFTRPR
jgi:hypothetical protein